MGSSRILVRLYLKRLHPKSQADSFNGLEVMAAQSLLTLVSAYAQIWAGLRASVEVQRIEGEEISSTNHVPESSQSGSLFS